MKRFIHTFLIAGLLFTGCSEKDEIKNPFEGTDNYLFSLVLHTDDADYKAEIVGDKISLTIAPGTSLEGVTAEYELSELSTISPNPADISDWNNEHQFTVTSYSGAKRVYTYECIESPDIYEGDIVLKTQADVDAFGALDKDIITGTLIVGTVVGKDEDGTPDILIKDVSSLSGIRKIQGNLIINNTVCCKTFEMPSLECVNAIRAGNTENSSQIGQLRYLNIEEFSFPNLRIIDGELCIYNDGSLSLLYMPSLSRIGGDLHIPFSSAKIQLNFDSLEEVQNVNLIEFNGTVRLPKLHTSANLTILAPQQEIYLPELEAAGKIVLRSNSVYCPKLRQCASMETEAFVFEFPLLETVSDGLRLNSYAHDSYEASFSIPKLTIIGGMLNVETWMWSKFTSLKQIGGVTLRNDKFDGMPMETLDLSQYEIGNLGIYVNCVSNTLTGPDMYSGTLTTSADFIKGFRVVKSLDIAGCKSNEFETVEENCSLSDVVCPSLRSVGKNMTVEGDCSLPVLRSVGRKLNINPSTEECSLPALEEIGDGTLPSTTHCLAIGEDAYLPNLQKIEFPKLKRVRGMLYMNPDGDLCGLKSISAPKLEEIEGAIYIGRTPKYNPYNCSILETIDFPVLRRASSVEINYNPMLKDFSAFVTVVETIKENKWKVSHNGYNPTYQDMREGKYKPTE